MAAIPEESEDDVEDLLDLLQTHLGVSDYEGKLQTPITSPIKGKHELTPGSRESILPTPKRHATGLSHLKIAISTKANCLHDELEKLRDNPYELEKIEELIKQSKELKDLHHAVLTTYDTVINEMEKSNNSSEVFNIQQAHKLKQEVAYLSKLTNTGIRTQGNSTIHADIFDKMVKTIKDECPLLHSVLENLVLVSTTERNTLKTNNQKMKMAVNLVMTGLLNIRNSRLPNDFAFLFGVLLVSYGAGPAYLNMLQSMGITVHWKTIMHHFDKQMEMKQLAIDNFVQKQMPVIVALDNINISKPQRSHDRAFRDSTSTVRPDYNLTGKCMIRPNLNGIEDLFHDKDTAEESQRQVKTMEASYYLIENNAEHKVLWDAYKDYYFLKAIDTVLNALQPLSSYKMLTCEVIDRFLNQFDIEKCLNNGKYKINIPKLTTVLPETTSRKTETFILPLSVEDNSTLAGQAVCLEEIAAELSIPLKEPVTGISFDEKKKSFHLSQARERYEFELVLKKHKDNRERDSFLSGEVDNQDMDINGFWKETDMHFKKAYEEIERDFQERFMQCEDYVASSQAFLFEMQEHVENWYSVRDHLQRNILHVAIEKNYTSFAKALLKAGANPNATEGCGATPLTLAVLSMNKHMVETLLQYHASFQAFLYPNIPNPQEMAEMMGLEEIASLFDEDVEDFENKEISNIFWEEGESHLDDQNCNSRILPSNVYSFDRSQQGCLTLAVGDQGTNKTIRGVQVRSNVHNWVCGVPGDLHAVGYLCEVIYKAQAAGGFLHISHDILKKKKVTPEAFSKKKFQDGNLQRIREECRDISESYLYAAIYEFMQTELFPSQDDLSECKKRTGSHETIVLQNFKLWLENSSAKDKHFRYRCEMLDIYGPLLELYEDSISYGCGLGREVAWMQMMPLFHQFNKPNYSVEAFVHLTNILAVWPIAVRRMWTRNCTVNINGEPGRGMAVDEFVEQEVVRPLKQYTSGKTTITMMKRIMGNIDLMKSVRAAYKAREAFDVHNTRRHREQTSLKDKVKAMWFCLKEGFFVNHTSEGENDITSYSSCGKTMKVTPSLINGYSKGVAKFKLVFKERLFKYFGQHETCIESEDDEDDEELGVC